MSKQPPEIYDQAAVRLLERRMALCMSILDIAKRLGVDPQRYRNWEKHFGPLPQQQYGAALARILDVDADWLLTGAGPTPAVPLVSSVLATDPFPLPEVPPDRKSVV